MTDLSGRVAVVTGAGRGIGRSHALALATAGAAIVVNDRGTDLLGVTEVGSPAGDVVEEIRRAGGEAVASRHDVADWTEAEALVMTAIETYGSLDILVNNAGIVRDRTIARLSEDEWDSVLRVDLKGHAAPSSHAFRYWRTSHNGGQKVRASVVHTGSIVGLAGGFGQVNYAAAKSGILGLSATLAIEGAKYGVRSNVIIPSARTRLTEDVDPRVGTAEEVFDPFDPVHVSPLIVWLAGADCPASGQILQIWGDTLSVISPPVVAGRWHSKGGWTADEIGMLLSDKLLPLPDPDKFLEQR